MRTVAARNARPPLPPQATPTATQQQQWLEMCRVSSWYVFLFFSYYLFITLILFGLPLHVGKTMQQQQQQGSRCDMSRAAGLYIYIYYANRFTLRVETAMQQQLQQQRLKTRHVLSRWYFFIFLFIILILFFLGLLNMSKRRWLLRLHAITTITTITSTYPQAT